MKCKVKFTERPYPHTPIGTGRQVYEGDLEGEILWCQAPVSSEVPAGIFGVHIVSRAVITPLAPRAVAAKPEARKAS